MTEKDIYTREGDKRFTLRIEQALFDKLAESAKQNKRAVGREIEYILENYFAQKPRKD